jgi:hypothetical protein
MKNKKLLFLIFAMTICVLGCSKEIRKLEISDDNFLFNTIGFKKNYDVETCLRAFNIGVHFKQPVLIDDIKLGTLEVTIVSENGQEQKIMLTPGVSFFYSDYKNKLVNRFYFETIDLGNEQFVQELNVSLINSFSVPIESELLITNLGTELFFVQ